MRRYQRQSHEQLGEPPLARSNARAGGCGSCCWCWCCIYAGGGGRAGPRTRRGRQACSALRTNPLATGDGSGPGGARSFIRHTIGPISGNKASPLGVMSVLCRRSRPPGAASCQPGWWVAGAGAAATATATGRHRHRHRNPEEAGSPKPEAGGSFTYIGSPNGPIQHLEPVRYVQYECYETTARSET
jgi:hypothetical protein